MEERSNYVQQWHKLSCNISYWNTCFVYISYYIHCFTVIHCLFWNKTFDMSQGGVHHLWVGVVGGVVVGWIEWSTNHPNICLLKHQTPACLPNTHATCQILHWYLQLSALFCTYLHYLDFGHVSPRKELQHFFLMSYTPPEYLILKLSQLAI